MYIVVVNDAHEVSNSNQGVGQKELMQMWQSHTEFQKGDQIM